MIVLKKLLLMSGAHRTWCKFDNFNLKYLLQYVNKQTSFRVQYFSSRSHMRYPMGKQVTCICRDFVKPFSLSSVRSYSDDVKDKKVLDDEDFKNILQDFAKDFDVNDDETATILKDIKENNAYPNDKKLDSDTKSSAMDNDTLDIYHSIQKKKFKEFEDKDSGIIYSYEEEKKFEEEDQFFHIDQEYDSHTITQEVKRGVTGVYDIEELIPILREEKLFDISVIQIAEQYSYADYMVLATAKSPRHAKAVTEFIRKFYKMKKAKTDPFVKIEGEKLGNWKAMDMGNIVLHVFLEDTRALYDIESLWLLDKQYDSGGTMEKDNVMDLMQEELDFMNCLNVEEETVVNQEDSK